MKNLNKKLTIFLTVLMAVILVIPVSPANAASAPSLSSQSASVTGPHNASLSIFVNPNGSPTSLEFNYWNDSTFSTKHYFGVNGTSSVRVQVGLINLREGSNYSYQVVATNNGGSNTGSVGTFTTPSGGYSSFGDSGNINSNTGSTGSSTGVNNGSTGSQTATAPIVFTNGPASITSNSVVVNGTINPNGAQTNFWFEFGSTSSLGQSTTTQSMGSVNSNQLVAGNITGLSSNKTYYYRVVGQNIHGTANGDVVGFTTPANSNQTTSTSSGQVSGQVLGLATTGGANSTNGSSGSVTSSGLQSSIPTVNGTNVSLEYSLSNSNALVLVAEDIKPKPGDQFTYIVSYKNNVSYYYTDARLKVIIPSEAEYIGSDTEPVNIEGSIVEFKLGPIPPKSQGTISIITRIREDVKPGTNMIFTSVLIYKNNLGEQEAVTSYMTVRAGQGGGSPLVASIVGAIFGSSGMLWLLALTILVVVGGMIYSVLRIRNGSKKSKNKDNEFDLSSVPSTFEPIGPDGPFKR